MNNILNVLATIFTGKGGTLRLAIFGSLFAAGLYELSDSGCSIGVTGKDGSSITFMPGTQPPAQNVSASDTVVDSIPAQE